MPIKRLLVVSSTYPSSADEKVPRFVQDQLEAFCSIDDKIRIDVLAPHNQASRKNIYPSVHGRITEHRFSYSIPKTETLTDRGIMPALASNKLNYLLLPLFMTAELFALYRLTKKTKPELIYVHWFTPQAINAYLVSKVTGIPFAFTTHAADVVVWKKFGWLGRKIVTTVSKKASVITSVSTRTTEKLVSFFPADERVAARKRVSIIPMGIHLSKATEKPSSNKGSVLFIGRLTEKKGVKYLLDAAKILEKSSPDIRITIAGDGEIMPQLKQQASELDLADSVSFAGYVHGKTKQQLLETHSVMVVPSIVTASGDAEGLPVSLMEGLAEGMICIATNVSGADDIIENNKHGFIIKQKDTEALASAIAKAVSLSPNEQKSLTDNALRLAEDLAWPSIAKQHLDLLNKA